jgi:hypothetical protein
VTAIGIDVDVTDGVRSAAAGQLCPAVHEPNRGSATVRGREPSLPQLPPARLLSPSKLRAAPRRAHG